MKKITFTWMIKLASAFVLMIPTALLAQTNPQSVVQFEFKGAHLGMTLSEFKQVMAAKTMVDVPRGQSMGTLSNMRSGKQEVDTPFCDDTQNGFDGDLIGRKAGEVICNPSPSPRMVPSGVSTEHPINPNLLDIAGVKVHSALYYFYEEKLYSIRIEGYGGDFNKVAQAFSEKYGTYQKLSPTVYSNALGARWAGQNLTWVRGTQAIVATEGSSNGPRVQPFLLSSNEYSTFIFVDHALEPPVEKKSLNF
jgi:hypothetical protein